MKKAKTPSNAADIEKAFRNAKGFVVGLKRDVADDEETQVPDIQPEDAMTEDEFRWVEALMEADETGDLRELFKLLVPAVPDWAVEQFAELAFRRLSAPRKLKPAQQQSQQRVARAAYWYKIAPWKPGEKRPDRVTRIADECKLSDREQQALRNLKEHHKGRPSVRRRRVAKQDRAISAYERSLRKLLHPTTDR